jgi:hypothetical protein
VSDNQAEFPIATMCGLLGVSPAAITPGRNSSASMLTTSGRKDPL